MNCKAFLVLALAALVAVQFAGAHPVAKRSCACALKGTDVCLGGSNCVSLRPSRPRGPTTGVQRVIYQKFAPVEFQPKNICTCEGGLVTAPEIPRVPCKVHGHAHQAPIYAVAGSSAALFGGSDDGCGDAPVNPCEENFEAPAPVRTYVIPADNGPAEELIEEIPAPAPQAPVAADAVSLALAYDLATKQQKNILEENLAFGHMQTPKDGRVVIKKRIVPESGLYAVRNQIVELKAPSGFGRSCEDEADASLLAAQQASCGEVEESSYSGSLPSYRDLGFAPVGGDCKFVPGTYQPAPQVVQTVEYSVPAPAVKVAAPTYSSCDTLSGLERGRGQIGFDYYSADHAASAAADEAAQEAGRPACEDESNPIYSAGLSYGLTPVAPRSPAPCGRPTCTCNSGY